MAVVHITTTRGHDLQALGTAGQSATESWSALRTLLAQRLGDAHAGLIAEPVSNPVQGETDWYADTDLPIQPMSSLPALEQGAVRAELTRLAGDILTLATAMKASTSESDRFLGAMLEFTMQIPDNGYQYVTGTQPVLVAWGHAKAGPGIERVYLTGERHVATRPMAILRPPAAPGVPLPRILPALVAGLLVAAMLLGAATWVVLRDPFGWYVVADTACRLAPSELGLRDNLAEASAREADLRLRLAQLSTDAGARRLQCRPVPVAAPPPPPTPPPSRDQQRAEQRGAQRGKLRVILAWDDRNDLDLSVACPNRDVVSWRRKRACGGVLDVDANGDVRTGTVSPVENIYFDDPAPGTYRVVVDPFAMHVSRSSAFRVTIQQEGKPDRVVTGVAELGNRQTVAVVTINATTGSTPP